MGLCIHRIADKRLDGIVDSGGGIGPGAGDAADAQCEGVGIGSTGGIGLQID